MRSSTQESALSEICVSCGLCCDGTLFRDAKAEPFEVERLESHGLETGTVSGKLRFKLGCRHLSGTSCSIYDQRFTICRSFRCVLLQRYAAGDVGRDQALETIATAKDLLGKVSAADPQARHVRHREAVFIEASRWPKIEDAAERTRAAKLYLDIVALETFLSRHFRKQPESGKNDESGD